MRQSIKWMINCAAACACASVFGYSNPIEGGTTETVTDPWTVSVPWMMVGSNSSSNMLFVMNGGQIDNQIGIIGNNISSTENMAFVSGSNAVWNNTQELAVGNLGSDNSLGVYGGGRVNTENAYIGKASSNNFASISGDGSELTATTLHLGHTGAENTMGVFDGGRISSDNASIGHWIGADGNYALVTGTNSVWENSGILNVGEYGSDSLLLVTDAGTVRSAVVNVGALSTSSNNAVSLWGEGSLLDAAELNIGGRATAAGGTGNRVSVRDGATVATTELTIHAGNNLDLNDGGTVAINNDFNASMDGFNWKDGGHLSVGGNLEGMPVEFVFSPFGTVSTLDGEGRALTLDGGSWSNTGNVAVGHMGSNNRLVVTNGGFVSGNGVYVGMNAGSSGNELLVSGSGSALESTGELFVGYKGHSNSVSVLDGGTLSTLGGQLGFDDSNGNSAIVSGAGSRWDSSIGMIIGQTGSGNTLEISDGGVVSAMQSTVGYFTGADSNAVVVTGKGSTWENENGLYLGVRKVGSTWYNGGQGNSLTVEDGAKVLVGNVNESQVLPYIGNESAIAVGDSTGNADMVVGNGSFVNTGYGIVGSAANERGSVVVTDSGTVWSNRDDMYVGYAGSGNELTIRNGARVENGYGLVGWVSGSDSNQVTVTGAGSVWESSKELRIGGDGEGNRMDIVNGGLVQSAGGVIGRSRGGDGDVASVTGAGSVWSSSTITVGAYGDNNLLEIKNGGLVSNGTGYIGDGEGTGNMARVTGDGSLWKNYGSLFVGIEGDNNQMEVVDGGRVESAFGTIGYYGANNSVLVSGDGSAWDSRSSLTVGSIAGGNSLVVSNGGQMASASGILGAVLNSHNNNVTVTGAGSEWINRGGLTVGNAGRNNSMDILEGGLVVSASGAIGQSSQSSGNRVTVSGSGSIWSNTTTLTMGKSTGNNRMEILDGGHVYNEIGTVGGNSISSTGNRVDVSGEGSLWHNRSALYLSGNSPNPVIGSGISNALFVADGGRVLVGTSDLAALPDIGALGAIVIGDSSNTAHMVVERNAFVGSDRAYLGLSEGDAGSVLVSGKGGKWVNNEYFHVGYNGGSNVVTVSNGGSLVSDALELGTFSDNNSVLVTGDGATVSIGDELVIGDNGANNMLVVSDAGAVTTGGDAIIGQVGDSNIVFVSGAGTVLDVHRELQVGHSGNGNYLEIADGGLVASLDGSIGYASAANAALVSGTGSVWQVNNELMVGRNGSGNELVVANGGRVENRNGFIGRLNNSDSNAVVVSGSDSTWKNTESLFLGGYRSGENWIDGGTGNALIVENGGRVLVGNVDTNQLPLIGNAAAIVVGDSAGYARFVVDNQSQVGSGNVYLGLSEGESGMITVDGGSNLDAQEGIIVGLNGSDSRLVTYGGSQLESKYATIGYNAGADGNSVLLDDSNWNVLTDLNVGLNGSESSLIVTNDGDIYVHGDLFVGVESDGNQIVVDGSSLRAGDYLGVGWKGSSNLMAIVDGTFVQSRVGWIGAYESSQDNEVAVSGLGSVWEVDELAVGGDGSDNSMTISDGGEVDVEQILYIGYHESASNNVLTVSGQGSELGADYIFLGSSGGQLNVADGAQVFSGGMHIAANGGNQVRVEGENAALTTGNIDINSDGNSFEIVGSGVVTGESFEVYGDNSTLMVQGDGSSFVSDKWIELMGDGNQLKVSDSGRVQSSSLYLYGSHNQTIIDGDESFLDLRNGQLLVDIGSSNLVEVSNGGKLVAGSSFVGIGTSSDNLISISGEGSEWQNTFDLSIGSGGTNNRLQIAEGGSVVSGDGTVGWNEGSTGNEALIAGYGSAWSNSGSLYVGRGGSQNRMFISDAGYVENQEGYIGYTAAASENSVTVSGAGSYWFNRAGLNVGYGGSGNELVMEDGGVVQTWGNSYIGHTGHSNSVTVSGANSAFGSGVMVPRVAIINPILPPYSGGGSEWVIVNPPVIGTLPEFGNPIIATNGATLGTGGEGIMIPGNNGVVISDGSFFGGEAGVVGYGNDVVAGDLEIGGSVIISNGTFIPAPSYMYEMSLGDLSVGYAGSYNSLDIEDGGLAASWNAFIGETSNAWMNAVSVSGSNSEFHVYRDLSLGGRMSPMYTMTSNGWENVWVDGGLGNSLYVGDGGLVTVGRDLHNRNYSSINVDPGAQINVASNYYQDASSSLRFGVETNAAGAPLNALVSVGGTAEFEAGARIEYASNVGQLQFDTFYTNKIIEADKLIVAGIEDADSLDLEMLDASGTLVDVLFWENEQDIYGLAGRVYLADSAGFSSNSMMARLSKEIDDLSLLGHRNAGSMINLLNTMSGSQQYAELTQLYARGTPNYQHGRSLSEGLNEIKKHTARHTKTKQGEPKGAAGPYNPEQGLRAWLKPYGMWADHASADGFSGYNHNVYGTVVGLDLPLEGALLGVAGGYGRSTIDQNDDDRSEARTGYGALYLNWGTEDWFHDVNLGFGRSKIDQVSGTSFDNSATFDASHFSAYFGGGKEISLNRMWTVTPMASLLWSYYYQESYADQSDRGVEREVAAYERNSFLSSLGSAISWQKEFKTLVLKPEARLYWLHEFNDDVEQVDYELAGGMGGQYHYLMPAAESDVLEAGLGISCLFSKDVELVLDVDGRFGEDYSAYVVSGRAVVEF